LPGISYVGQVTDLVDAQELRVSVVVQPAMQRGAAVLGGELVQHGAGGGETHRVAAHHAVVREVLEQHGFPDAVRAEQHGVRTIFKEAQLECKRCTKPICFDVVLSGMTRACVNDTRQKIESG
jgi:hypothetical protein